MIYSFLKASTGKTFTQDCSYESLGMYSDGMQTVNTHNVLTVQFVTSPYSSSPKYDVFMEFRLAL